MRSGRASRRPLKIVTFRFFNRPVTPPANLSITDCLRSSVMAQSAHFGSTITPKSPACFTVRTIAAVSSSSLAGMQPRCRQVPPILSNSTSPTSRPADAPYSAAA